MRQIRKGFLLLVGASALAACASHAPVNSAGTASASGSAPVATAPVATADAGKPVVPKGYRLVVKNGNEYFCRMQAVTGSHALKTEICLTQDQLDAELAHHTTG
jgi:hypothetical protein